MAKKDSMKKKLNVQQQLKELMNDENYSTLEEAIKWTKMKIKLLL